jgi:hypothetical protein
MSIGAYRGKKKKKKGEEGHFGNEMLACVTILVFQNTQRPFVRKIFIKIRHRV